MNNNYDYIIFDYDTSTTDRQREVEEFYKTLDSLNFDDILQSSSVSSKVLSVSRLDVRSVINGGAYYQALASYSSYWNSDFISNYNYINRYQTSELSTRQVQTFQKLMNQFKKSMKVLATTSRADIWNVVKYSWQYGGLI